MGTLSWRARLALGFFLVFLLASVKPTLLAAQAEVALTTNSADQQSPAIEGDNVVWLDFRDGQPDLYAYNISTRQERRITSTSAREDCIGIHQGRAFWMDNRSGQYLPYFYDLASNTETSIPVTTGIWSCPWMDGDRVVWIASNTSKDMYVRTLSTGTTQLIPLPATNDRKNPRLYGSRLVRQDWINPGPWHLFVYDFATGTNTPVGTTTAKQETPWLWQDRVVVEEYRQGDFPTSPADIYYYNLISGSETQITSGPAQQDGAVIFGDRIIWADNRNSGNGFDDLYLYDLAAQTEQRLTSSFRALGGYGISGGRIVWSDNRTGNQDIYLLDLQPGLGEPAQQLAIGNNVYNFANFPWGKYFNATQGSFVYTYGMDFGFCPLSDARRIVNNPQIAQDLDAMKNAGVEGVRWFVIPDGRNLTFDANRTPTGRGAGFKDDLWAAMDMLESRGMGAVLTLIDGNNWFKPEGTYQGAFFGHARVITDPVKRQALYNTVIIPILQDILAWHAANPARHFPISAIDLGNELLFGTDAYQGTGATIADMQTYARETAALVHQYLPHVPVTAGGKDAQDLIDYWTDAALGVSSGQGLDFYSFHLYNADLLQGPNGLRARFNLDQLGKRIYLEEYPGKNAALGGPEMYLAPIGGLRGTRLSEGWLSGSFLWSFNGANDGATPDDPIGTLNRINNWFINAFDKPDLIVANVFYPGSLSAGIPVSFQFTVANQGGVTADTNRFEAFLDGNALGFQMIPALAPGDTAIVVLPATPWTATEGTHSLWSKADVWLNITEADENNNEDNRTVTVGPQLPDLIISDIAYPSAIAAGQSVQFSITIKNQTSASAGASRFELWLDGIQLGVSNTPPLAGGATTTFTLPATPWIATSGTHYLWAKTDAWLEVNEMDDNNNVAERAITVLDVPDLIMTAVSGPASTVTGGKITVSNTVTNQAAASIGSFSVGIYLSADASITTADVRIGTRSVASLAGGASNAANTDVTIPNTLAPGNYTLGAIADYNNQRAESNEANNARTGNTIAITPGADLVVTALSGPTSAARGSVITVSNTVANQGTGSSASSTLGIYLSTDGTITTSDRRITTRSVGGLNPSASSSANTSITLPSNLARRTYTLGAIADYNNQRAESNEANNARTGNTITIN